MDMYSIEKVFGTWDGILEPHPLSLKTKLLFGAGLQVKESDAGEGISELRGLIE
jgi:hypothetical protein